MKLLTFISDYSGCYRYRCVIPYTEQRRHNVDTVCLPYLPNHPGESQMNTLIRLMEGFDICIVQRCYRLSLVSEIKKAAEFLGIPCIFETDDDYLNLPFDNPAYFSIIDQSRLRADMTIKELEALREPALDEYREILRMMDAVTVSTEELKSTIAPYNKNIEVFQNNLLNVYKFRTNDLEESITQPDGTIHIKDNLGMITIPNLHIKEERITPSPRIGYACTASHRGQDWDTIKDMWERLIDKYSKKNAWFVYVGADPGPDGSYSQDYWIKQHHELIRSKRLPNRAVPIRISEYEMYNMHLRNLDVAIAPLHMNNIFNQSKSDLKILEASAWQVPSVAPNYITYNRNFKHGENVMLYNNPREFYDYCELLINDHKLRYELGQNAMTYTENNRLEKLHAERRYNFYKSLVDQSYPLKVHTPTVKELATNVN